MDKFGMLIIEAVLVIFVSVYSILTWYFFGRDPKRKAVVPEFNVPDNISAMFIAYINGERDSIRILKIGILSLLSKNYISVIKDKKGKIKKFILNNKNKKNLELRKTNLFEEENELLDILSEGDLFFNKQLILKYKNRIVHFLEKKYKKTIYKNNYFCFIPFILGTAILLFFILLKLTKGSVENSVRTTIAGIIWLKLVYDMSRGVLKFLYITVVIGGIIGVIMYVDIYSGISLFALGIIFLVYEKAIGKYTTAGRRKMEYIEGMKMYFNTTERYRIDKFETQEEKLNYFNYLLPYAVALKIEDESFKLFMDSLNFLNMMGNYKEAKYFVDEYTVSIFPNKLFKNVFDFFKVWLIKIR